jgi:hypothetical protein
MKSPTSSFGELLRENLAEKLSGNDDDSATDAPETDEN